MYSIDTNYLVHHGILGMRWGKKNGPPYPLGASDHSASETSAGWRNSLGIHSNGTKKWIKVGAAAIVTGLALYGGYKLYNSGKLTDLVANGKNAVSSLLGKNRVTDLGSAPKSIMESKGPKLKPSEAIKGRNPFHYRTNCKDVSLATALSYNGHGEVVAGKKSHYGNLHDFMSSKFSNVTDSTVKSITADPSNAQDRVTKNILKRCTDGDAGLVGVSWDPAHLKPGAQERGETGHAFNFFVENGKVLYKDAQPDPPREDASFYFTLIDSAKEIEWVKIDDALIPIPGELEKSLSIR